MTWKQPYVRVCVKHGRNMKTIKIVNNNAGGIDLIVDKDAGNPIYITTGKREKSVKFWLKLSKTCDSAIEKFVGKF